MVAECFGSPFTFTGDTLAAIAQRTGTTTTELAAENCLSNPSAIEVGQLLYVPPTY
jgi:LysM repeat protein